MVTETEPRGFGFHAVPVAEAIAALVHEIETISYAVHRRVYQACRTWKLLAIKRPLRGWKRLGQCEIPTTFARATELARKYAIPFRPFGVQVDAYSRARGYLFSTEFLGEEAYSEFLSELQTGVGEIAWTAASAGIAALE